MKAREFERILSRDGCSLVRRAGDHHMWKLPNGQTFVVPVGGKHTDVKKYLLTRYTKLKDCKS